MIEFVAEYGMFAAKVFTVIFLALVGFAFMLFLLSQRSGQGSSESIEIEKLNDKIEETRELLEEELLSKEEFKASKKARKKKEKAEEKARKKSIKKGETEENSPRLFVLRFDGDMQASDVYNLREGISALLSVATTKDEVLVTVDSGGGYVHNYGLAASQLARIRQRKIPLTVSIDLVAASGGYLMASVANKIIAAPFAIVGSIGVLAQIPNFYRLLKKHDIDVEQHTAGEYKRTLTMLGENTNKGREKFKEELEETHELFKQFVLEHRPQLDIDQIATGEHWYGTRALEMNLVDELTTSDDYLLEKSDEWDIYEINYVVNETLIDKLSGLVQGISSKVMSLLRTSPLH